MDVASIIFFAVAVVGVPMVALQTAFLGRFLRRPASRPTRPGPAISILKPLSGLDDGLLENLESFAALDYPEYEVLLGMKSADDGAMAAAQRMVERWPERFRIVLQQGAPGLNPKVNQLITLAKAARHDVLLVSDASVRVGDGYLPEIAAWLEDPAIGLVTHVMAATGERTLGSLFDNLYLMSHYSAGAIAADEATGQPMVNGKSLVFRRADLEAMGGFDAVRDYAAEDFILGRWVGRVLGRKVAFARNIPQTISMRRTVGAYLKRYERWTVMQRFGVGYGLYAAHTFMYPILHASLALVLCPSAKGLALWGAIAAAKSALDYTQSRMIRPGSFSLWALFLGPVNDLLIGWMWCHGLLHDRLVWRGNLLEVTKGTRLVPIRPAEATLPEAEAAGPVDEQT